MAYYDENRFFVAEDQPETPQQSTTGRRGVGVAVLIAGVVIVGAVVLWLVAH